MFSIQQSNSSVRHHQLSITSSEQTSYVWSSPHICPFDELLISWNALRPLQGHYVILSSVWTHNRWSPWLLYAIWGARFQYSFEETASHAPVRSFQDQIELLDGEIATGFRIRIEACGGATLTHFYTLHACSSMLKLLKPVWQPPLIRAPLSLPVPKFSQLCLTHPRASSLCSPTSTTSVINYLLSKECLNPLQLAQHVYDAGFDIYGNWPFNIAQAFVELGTLWRCFCARLSKFEQLWNSLRKGYPVVASIQGKLTGSFLNYSQGHLVVIRGYHPHTREFLCMDPAFPSNDQTWIAYPEEEFKLAWEKRGYLAYFFEQIESLVASRFLHQ